MKIYIASHIRHARRWIKLRQQIYPKLIIVSSWIDFLKNGEPDCSQAVIAESWENNIKDIIICDMLVLYTEENETPRGAAFEAGVAYAMGKPVLHAGDRHSLGTMACCFEHFPTLEACLTTLASEQDAQDLINARGSRAVN